MKIQNSKSHNQGSVLLISLMVCAIIGTMLASYLVLTQTQNLSVARSQNWNAAIAVSEAGVEEALSQLNRGTPYFEPAEATNNLASNGWYLDGGSYRAPRRYLGQDYYEVTITLVGQTPVINSTGCVYMAGAYAYGPQTFFAAAGTDGGYDGPSFQPRRVKVNTKWDPMFSVAMAAIKKIDFSGRNVRTDSFDSVDLNFSTGGLYDTAKTKDNGDVATNETVTNSLAVGNASIKGQVKTGPNGTISIGPLGSVGTAAWVNGGKRGIEPGRSANDMNVFFPDVTLPNVTWFTAPKWNPPIVINGQSYSYVLGNGNWRIAQVNSSVYVAGDARLLVTETINLTGSDQIRLAANNASLRLYMQGATARIAGNGVVNGSGNAANFYYYGLPSNTDLDFGGNNAFTGAIYAPQADFSLGGGGNDTYDFVGASVSRTVKMNGHFNFHYDENLARVGPGRGFIPSNWKED